MVKLGTTRFSAGWLLLLLAMSPSLSAGATELNSPTLRKIESTRTILIGHRQDEMPFSYVLSNGSVVGYSVDICAYVAEEIRKSLELERLDIEYVVATPATRFVLVKSGKVDLECSATTNTAERREQVEFSYPHFITATRFVSKASSNLERISDLAGRTVASTTGTINIEQLQSRNRASKLNISVLLAKHNSEGFALMENSRASAFVMDGVLLAAQVASSVRPEDYVISSETFGAPEPYGLMLRKNDSGFKDVVNKALHKLFVSGDIRQIYDRWFMSPVPPLERSFNLPISPELNNVFVEPKEYVE